MKTRFSFNFHVFRPLAVTLLLFGLISVGAFAQSAGGRVNGNVKDVQGAVVAGVTVTLTDIATGRPVTTTTNTEGYFLFPDVRAGMYRVTAEAAGFKKTEVSDVEVNVGQTATVTVAMEVGAVGETVTVTSSDAQSLVHTENAELSTTVQTQQINDLPLNGRNPLTLAGLQAGVNSAGAGTRTASVNGLRGTFTNLTWDGININDNFIRTDSFFGVAAPSVASVAEFTLTTQNAGAADGLGVAQVKLITPRGSSEFHGSVFEFHRNDRFDANTFFNNAAGRFVATDAAVVAGRAEVGDLRLPKPKLIQNQFGFNVGGPMVLPRFGEGGDRTWGRDKLFFYFFYEGTRLDQEGSRTRTFLTENARNGLFTYRRADNGQLQTVNLLSLSGRPIDPITAELARRAPLPNDPTTLDLANVAGGTAVSNFGTFRFNSPLGSTSDLWGFRTDFDASARHRFEAIFNRFTFDFPNSGGEPFPGAPGDGQTSKRPRGSFAWNWTPTESMFNELRFGFNHYDVIFFTNEPFNRGYRIVQPLISDSEDNFLPQGRLAKTYDLIDNATWVRGNHTFFFGGNYRNNYIEPFNDAGILPQFNVGFAATSTPNPLANNTTFFPGGISTNEFNNARDILAILTGPISQATQTFNAANRTEGYVAGATQRQQFKYFSLSGYGQDSWRIRPNLTVNLGLRYEFISVPREQQGIVLLPTNPELSVLLENAVLDFASGGDRRGFFPNDKNNFAPHFSFAWDPFGEGKFSLRGGYSISYVIDNNITTVLNAVRGNPGIISSTRTITGAALANRTPSGGVPTIAPPTFQVPRTVSQNLTEFGFGSAFFTFDPNFRTPYVQQWNVGVEKELFWDTVGEVRYVGNRGTKLTRGIDNNQLKVLQNTAFITDFRRAQFNIANCNGNPNPSAAACPGRQALTYIPQLGLGGFLTDAGVRNLIAQGQAGSLAEFYAGANRPFFFGQGVSTIPVTDFLPNPNTFVADLYCNCADSWYNGLQAEVRRRFNDGLYFQANYTFSKNLTNYGGTQSNFAGLMDLTQGTRLEKQRGGDDITHVFKSNWIYEFPIGPGKRFADRGGFVGKLLGGWSLNGLLRWQSGEPVSITSARGTVNRGGRSTVNTVNSTLSVAELQSRTGLYFDPTTGRPRLFDPTLIAAVRANPENNEFLTNPRAGFFGNLQLTPVSGPSVFFMDASLIKRTNITERVNMEFRVEAFNVLNHTAFDVRGTDTQTGAALNVNEILIHNINSTAFGQIDSTFAPRVIQFAAKFNF
ncbi:MAG TPA: TonB-dependent receptor [Pyrinomonadaceae bacterium]|nr:TonB-dependent receptor [Pyrinomonadaceae bacterium]